MASRSDSRVAALIRIAQQERIRFLGKFAYHESKPLYSCFWNKSEPAVDWGIPYWGSQLPKAVVRALCQALPLTKDPYALSFPGNLVYNIKTDAFVPSEAYSGATMRQLQGVTGRSRSSSAISRTLHMYLAANKVPDTAHLTFLALLGQLLHEPGHQSSTHVLAMRIPAYEEWGARALLWRFVPEWEWACVKRPQHALSTMQKAVLTGKPHLLIDARLWTDSAVSNLLHQLQETDIWKQHKLYVVLYLPDRAQALGACEASMHLVPFDLTSIDVRSYGVVRMHDSLQAVMHMHNTEYLVFVMLVSGRKKGTSLHQATGLFWNSEARVGWARQAHGQAI
jgi:hypothetical protein